VRRGVIPVRPALADQDRLLRDRDVPVQSQVRADQRYGRVHQALPSCPTRPILLHPAPRRAARFARARHPCRRRREHRTRDGRKCPTHLLGVAAPLVTAPRLTPPSDSPPATPAPPSPLAPTPPPARAP